MENLVKLHDFSTTRKTEVYLVFLNINTTIMVVFVKPPFFRSAGAVPLIGN
jgi:hypothetical protein